MTRPTRVQLLRAMAWVVLAEHAPRMVERLLPGATPAERARLLRAAADVVRRGGGDLRLGPS